jgi:hypothetical protein
MRPTRFRLSSHLCTWDVPQEVAGLNWKNRMYPLHGDVKYLLFTFLFMRKEEGMPVLKYPHYHHRPPHVEKVPDRPSCPCSSPIQGPRRTSGWSDGTC